MAFVLIVGNLKHSLQVWIRSVSCLCRDNFQILQSDGTANLCGRLSTVWTGLRHDSP